MNKNWLNTSIGLIKWSLIRHKYYIPIFVVVQVILSVAIIYGFSFVTNAEDNITKSFLYTGAIAINIIAVACVLSPQIVSEAKQNGVFDYQKTLPIQRVGIILSDLLIWGVLALPGVLLSIFLATINMEMQIDINLFGVLNLLFVIVSLVLFGFSIAYLFPPNIMTLVTQLIMIGGLLFSPIIYSSDRLPSWMAVIYNCLPFVPVSNIIRYSLLGLSSFRIADYFVVTVWAVLGFSSSMYVLSRRK